MHSGDEMEVEAPEDLKISDAKEVFIPHIRKRVTISSRVFTSDEHGTFMKLVPQRNAHISKLLLSRCPNQIQIMARKDRSFWTSKSKPGFKFLRKLRRLRHDAITLKFDVKGKRFMSRSKKQRAQQLVLEALQVPLPTVGEHVGKNIKMKIDASAVRKNGKSPLWVELDPQALSHLARVAHAWIEDGDEDGLISPDPEGDDDRGAIDAMQVNDNNSNFDTQAQSEPNSEMNVESPSDASTAALSSLLSEPSSASSSPSSSYKSSPLFQAFMRSSQKP